MMTVLILGVALWVAAHLFKRIAPTPRAALTARMGDGSKGVFAVLIVLSVVLMIVGYRGAEFVNLWFPPTWLGHVNNLLMLVAFYVFGIGMAKGALSQRVRHPMLGGFTIWAAAHLLVNGDLASVILFGGLGTWAVVAMLIINGQDAGWARPQRKRGPRDAVLAGIVLVTYGVVGMIHLWLGVNPFGSIGG